RRPRIPARLHARRACVRRVELRRRARRGAGPGALHRHRATPRRHRRGRARACTRLPRDHTTRIAAWETRSHAARTRAAAKPFGELTPKGAGPRQPAPLQRLGVCNMLPLFPELPIEEREENGELFPATPRTLAEQIADVCERAARLARAAALRPDDEALARRAAQARKDCLA